jgi:hypothetical protein
MRSIYKCATTVRIWLGEEADDSAIAMEIVNRIGRSLARGPGDAPVAYPNVSPDKKLLHWKAVSSLFRRSWWDRAWIRQEVALAKFPTVQCGSVSCPLDSFVKAGAALEYVTNYLGYDPTASGSADASGAESDWSLSGTKLRRCSTNSPRTRDLVPNTSHLLGYSFTQEPPKPPTCETRSSRYLDLPTRKFTNWLQTIVYHSSTSM